METLATREKVYAYIRKKILEGLPPSVREVQKEMGFRSSGTAREHIDSLVAEGRLERIEASSRGLRLPASEGKFRPEVMVPVVGRVQAGKPELAVEDPAEFLSYRTRFPEKEMFALKVRGESMSGAGIMPGDYVIVHRQPSAEPGQIVVAFLGTEEVTVKTLKRKNGQFELHPENGDYPILIPSPLRPLTIVGLVLEVRRPLVTEN
jgi:repressor LexA